MAMKMMKKVLSAVAAAALVVASVPAIPTQAANEIVKYDFESGLGGMTSTGFGTDPTIVQDATMGNVLQFADGGSSSYITGQEDSSLANDNGKANTRIENGTPSSLQFANPFCGKSLTGMSISMWVKVPSGAGSQAPGLLGFVSNDVTREHPDKVDSSVEGDKSNLESSTGKYAFGITGSSVTGAAIDVLPMLYLAGLHHNWYMYVDEQSTFNTQADQWVFMVVSISNGIEETKVYVNGEDIDGVPSAGKRYNKGEDVGGTAGNTTEPTLTEILTMADMPTAYVGFTGFSPTVSGVCIDDLTFYDAAVSGAEAMNLYTTAQAAVAGKTASGGSGTTTTAGGTNATAGTTTGGSTDANGTGTASTSGGGSTSNGSGSGSSTTSGGTTSTGSTSTSSTNNTNLPQTGVVETSVLVACGVAAVAGGAFLFKKKDAKEEN